MQTPSYVSVLPFLMLGTSDQKATKQVSLIISQKGDIRYHNANGEQQQIRAGAVVKNSGSLHLDEEEAVLLYGDGHFISISEAGTHSLSTLLPSGRMKKLNYDSRFGQYLMAALDLVVHAKDEDGWSELSGSKGGGDGWGELSGSKGGGDGWGELSGSKKGGDGYGELSGSKGGGDGWGELSGSKKGGDGYGELSGSKKGGDAYGELSGSKEGGDGYGELSGSKEGGDGWGDQEGRIVPILPFGKINGGPVVFQWSQPATGSTYILEILDASGSIVHSTQATDNWTPINLDTLSLKTETPYAWRINVPSQTNMASTKARISISQEDTGDIVKKKLARSDAYQLNDPILCRLMEAVVLEEQAYFYEAYQRYEMLRQSHKDNDLVKLMQAAFYVRHQLKPRARSLFI